MIMQLLLADHGIVMLSNILRRHLALQVLSSIMMRILPEKQKEQIVLDQMDKDAVSTT
jgi:hypothetical protein